MPRPSGLSHSALTAKLPRATKEFPVVATRCWQLPFYPPYPRAQQELHILLHFKLVSLVYISRTSRLLSIALTLGNFHPNKWLTRPLARHVPWIWLSQMLSDSKDFKFSGLIYKRQPLAEAVPSEARNVFASSKTGAVGSNLAQGMDVSLRFISCCWPV
jgi:hypothetical protein